MATEKKKSWGRRWLVVLVLLALVVAGATILILPRIRGRARLFYNQGVLHMRSGDTQAALTSFQRALAKDPTLLEAQVGIVRALIARKEFALAEQELTKAADMGYPEADTAVLRASLLSERAVYGLSVGQAAVTLDLCAKVITDDLDPAIALVQKHADKAAEPATAFSRLGDLLMQKSRVQSIEWQLHRAQGDRAKAVGRTDEAAEQDKQAARIVSAMGQSQHDAMAAYERAMKLDPKLTGPRLAVAEHAITTYVPQPERARAVLEPIIAQTPDHRSARLMLATVERLEGHYDKALENVAAARGKGEDDFELLVAKGQILQDAGRWDELLPVSARLVQLKPSDSWAAYLRGRALLLSKQPDPAKRKEAVQEAANSLQVIFQHTIIWPQARLALAQAMVELGNQEQARSAYKHTLDDIKAGQALNIEQGRQIVQVAYEANMALYQAFKDENPTVAEGYARGAFQAKPELDEGYKAARAALAAANEAPSLQEDVAIGHAAAIRLTGDVDGALAACNTALTDPPTPLWGQRLSLFRARLLVTKGSFLDAVKAYEGIRAKWNDKMAARELASLHLRFGRTAEALAVYQDAVRSFPTDQDAMVDLLGLLVRTGKQDEARAALANAEQQFGPETARSLMLGLYLHEGQIDQAISLQRSLVQLTPQKAAAHVALAELLWQKGDLAGARAAFDQALTLDPTYQRAYARALIDLEEGRYDQAADLMRKGVKQFPDQIAMPAHLAIAEQAGGNSADAVALLQKALTVEGLPQGSSDLLHWYLATTYAGMGDAQKARTENPAVSASEIGPAQARQDLLDHIVRMEEAKRQKAATALNLLVVFSRARHLEAAVAQVSALQDLLPGEPLPACLRADLLDEQGKHQEAVSAYKAVISANPDFAYARIKLVDSLVGAGEEPAAVPVLEEALAHVAPGQAALLHFQLGRIHEKEGKVDDAIAEYKLAMADRQVLPLAANNLAWLLATARNDPAGALPYAEQAADAAGGLPSVADTLGWIRCLNGEVADAIPLLEKAKAGQGPNPTVRYHLGMAYLKAGRLDEARAELREALAISSTFPEADEASRALGGL